MMRLSQQLEIINKYRRKIPVDIEGLSESLGVPVHYAYLNEKISGMIEQPWPGEFVITIQQRDPHTRQRFTIAHELGHFIYHRHLIGDGVDDDRGYRSVNSGKYHNTKIGPHEETDANKFAASVLMPPDMIDHYGRIEATERGENPDNYRSFSIARVLASKFNVSEKAMLIQLGLE